MLVWKLSESLDFMEILRTATFAFKEKWCTPSSQDGNPTLNRVEKRCLLSSTRCQERFFSRLWTPDLRLRPPRWSSYDSSIIGPSEERWSQRLQNEITARLSTPRGNQSWGYRKILPLIQWTGRETQPRHHGQGFAACLSMQTWFPSSGLMLHMM